MLASDARYAVSEFVLSRLIRIGTHTKFFNEPSTIQDALTFSEQVREQPNALLVETGGRHQSSFRRHL
jgi:hypothetical protein